MRSALLVFALAIGCGGTPIEDHPCPPNMPHTYENFGRRFFTEHSALDNTAMPPGPDDPPEAERRALADWLACGAP